LISQIKCSIWGARQIIQILFFYFFCKKSLFIADFGTEVKHRVAAATLLVTVRSTRKRTKRKLQDLHFFNKNSAIEQH